MADSAWTVAATIGVGTLTVAINGLFEIVRSRRDARARAETRWNNVIQWARIVADEREPMGVRQAARAALEEVGAGNAVLDEVRTRQRNLADRLFSESPALDPRDAEEVRDALESSVAIGPVARRLGELLSEADQSEDARRELHYRETQIRIWIMIFLMSAAFMMLAYGAVRQALGY